MTSGRDALCGAETVWRHWRAGSAMDALPEACRPRDRAAGYAVQALLPAVADDAVVGWKIAATSAAGQAHIGVTGPMAGRLLASKLAPDGADLSLQGNRMRVAEAEFAFRLGADLAPRAAPYDVDEALALVASLHPAIEVPDSRYVDFVHAGEAQLIADNACAGRFVCGPAAPELWRSLDLSTHVVNATHLDAHGERRVHRGTGANVLGDPRRALVWLLDELSRLGLSAHAGDLVTTGTCLTPVTVAPGDAVEACFGALGCVSARFH